MGRLAQVEPSGKIADAVYIGAINVGINFLFQVQHRQAVVRPAGRAHCVSVGTIVCMTTDAVRLAPHLELVAGGLGIAMASFVS